MAKTARVTVEPKPFVVNIDCTKKRAKGHDPRWTRCMCKQYCAKVRKMDEARLENKPPMRKVADASDDPVYKSTKTTYIRNFMARVRAKPPKGVRRQFMHPCAADEYEKMKPKPVDPTKSPDGDPKNAPFNADHVHEAQCGGDLGSLTNFKMLSGPVNNDISFQAYEPEGKHKGMPIKPHPNCQCPDGPAPDP